MRKRIVSEFLSGDGVMQAPSGGKRLLPERVHAFFKLKSATPYPPSGVVGLHYERDRQAARAS
jgi:hypothetical protein